MLIESRYMRKLFKYKFCQIFFQGKKGVKYSTVAKNAFILRISFFLMLTIIMCGGILLAKSVQFLEKIKFSKEFETLGEVWDFCVTHDGLFIIPDFGKGDVKIYEKSGNVISLINKLGQRGYGPDGFLRPTFCFYNNEERIFGILDIRLRKIVLYDRISRSEFKRKSTGIHCPDLAYDIQLKGGKLFIAGYIEDSKKRNYSFYSVSLNNPNEKDYLLSSHYLYGFNEKRSFKEQLEEKHVGKIGVFCYFDIHEDEAYVVWEGNLKINPVNINSKNSINSFGEISKNYIRPFPTRELIDSYYKDNEIGVKIVKQKYSFVSDIFVSSISIYIIYQGPIKENGENIWIQVYTMAGKFKGEFPLKRSLGRNIFFITNHNSKNTYLYLLSRESQDRKSEYIIWKYKIKV